MMPWSQRTLEERRLLNPAFCAQLIWRAARGHSSRNNALLALEEAFLVLPLVLHGEIRQSLPHNTRTSMPVWLESEPLRRRWIAAGARMLVSNTREALLFGGLRRFIEFDGSAIRAHDQTSPTGEARTLKLTTDEVRDCAKRAEFIGKWMSHTGSAPTVLALLGVRP
jgi:hypothetical protein